MSIYNVAWILQQPSFNTTGIETEPTITVDSSGSLYVAYVTNGTVSGQTSTGNYDIVVMKLSNNSVVQWVAQQPTFNTTSLDRYPSIGHDQSGNSYVAYYTQGVTSGQTMTGSKGNVAVFKLDASGLCQWVTQQPTFNLNTDNVDPSVAVDSSGNTYVTYCANGTGSPEQYEESLVLEITYTSSSYASMSMVAGDSHWQSFVPFENRKLKEYGGYIDCSSGQFYYKIYRGQGTTGLVVDTSPTIGFVTSGYQWQTTTIASPPNLYRYQYYTLQVTCTSGTIEWAYASYPQQIYPYGRTDFDIRSSFWFEIYTTQPIVDLVTFKLDTDGNLLWMVEQPPLFAGGQFAPSMTIDTSGCSYIAFYTDGATSGQITTGGYDIAIIKLDSSGVYQWASQKSTFNTPSDDINPSLACDPQNNLYVAYQTNGVASGQTVTGTSDIVVFKLNSSGETQWVSQKPTFNAYGNNTAPSIAFSPSGFVYVVYQTTGAVSGQVSTGGIDVVYVVFDGSGNVHLATQATFNTTGDDTQPDLAVDTSGVAYVVYKTTGQASGQTLTGLDDLVIFSVVPNLLIIGFVSYTYTPPPDPTVGTEITYIYDVQNLGSVSATCSILDHSTTITLGYIPVGGNTTATSVYNLIQDDFDRGYVVTQAVATAIYLTGTFTTQASLTINLPQIRVTPIIGDYYGAVVSLNPPIIYQGDTIVYTYKITNSGNITIPSCIITDNIGTPALVTGNIPYGVTTYTNAHIITQEEINQEPVISQAIVTSQLGAYRITSLPVTTSVTLTHTLLMSVNFFWYTSIPTGLLYPGSEIIRCTYIIANDSNVPLSNCYIVDQSSHTISLGTLAAYAEGWFISPNSHIVTQAEGESGIVSLTSTIGGFWGPTSVTATETVELTQYPPFLCQMLLLYTGNITSYPVVYGTPVTYYICVQNTGTVPLESIVITDTLGYSTTITTITAGQYQIVSYTYLVTSGDLVADRIISTATASGEYPPLSAYANDSTESYLWLSDTPLIDIIIEKYTGYVDDYENRIMMYNYQLNNNGNTVLTNVTVHDTLIGNVIIGTILPNQTVSLNKPYPLTVTNIVDGYVSNQMYVTATSITTDIISITTNLPQFEVPVIAWVRNLTTDGDNTLSKTVYNQGLYVSYMTTGTALGQVMTGNPDVVLCKLDATGEQQWITQTGSFNTNRVNQFPSIAGDSIGNVLLAYQTNGTMYPSVNLEEKENIIACQFKSDGTIQWLQQPNFQTTTDMNATPAITTDINGDSYIAYEHVSSGLSVIGVSKLNSHGESLWINPDICSVDQNCWNPSIGVDTSFNSYIAYSMETDTSGSVVVVSKLDSSGITEPWFTSVVVSDLTEFSDKPSIAVDEYGTSYTIFQYEWYNVILGWKFAITSLDVDGSLRWTFIWDEFYRSLFSNPPQITLDSSSNMVFCYTEETGSVSRYAYNGNSILVGGLDTDGNLLWTYYSSQFDSGLSVNSFPAITTDQGSVYITYQTSYANMNGETFSNKEVRTFKLTYTPAVITLDTSGVVSSSGYNLYTYVVGNSGVVDLTNVTINDTLGASGLLGTIVPMGSVTITYIHATTSGSTSTATAIGLYIPGHLVEMPEFDSSSTERQIPPPYYVSAQKTITV